MDLLVALKDLVNNNPTAFLLIFLLSCVANVIQVYTFLRDRRRFKEEEIEKVKLNNLLDTYRYTINLAKINMRTEEQLDEVQKEIANKTTLVDEMSERVGNLQKVAQRELVSQALNQDITTLIQKY